MKFKFRKIKLSASNKIRLNQINSIIDEYQAEGYKMTLRQLYYQLVSRDIIPNQQKEYAKLSNLLKEGRMGGIVDWNAIEDRLRKPEKPSSWADPEEILEACASSYEKPRMDGQKTYVEVWVEKDALSGVLSRVTEKYHVPILVNRGYSSASAMYDSFTRFNSAYRRGQKIVILYLGDHDPSGIDMIRDVKHRILEFFLGDYIDEDELQDLNVDSDYMEHQASKELMDRINLHFEVIPIALTRAQIKQYNPPPNPAKMKDPRSGEYVKENGRTSWEVDALRPDVLHQILDDSILDCIDLDLYQSIVDEEESDKEKLLSLKRYL